MRKQSLSLKILFAFFVASWRIHSVDRMKHEQPGNATEKGCLPALNMVIKSASAALSPSH